MIAPCRDGSVETIKPCAANVTLTVKASRHRAVHRVSTDIPSMDRTSAARSSFLTLHAVRLRLPFRGKNSLAPHGNVSHGLSVRLGSLAASFGQVASVARQSAFRAPLRVAHRRPEATQPRHGARKPLHLFRRPSLGPFPSPSLFLSDYK
jgi:hypothetical protein